MNDVLFELRSRQRVTKTAVAAMGQRNWALLVRYGRLTSGPNAGYYVSALSADEARQLLRNLAAGRAVDVHLLHRHVSGDRPASQLLLRDRRLWMLFPDRSELA